MKNNILEMIDELSDATGPAFPVFMAVALAGGVISIIELILLILK